jgi:beta-fructofuranosidase
MVIALDDKWIWDSWYARYGESWHGYFLQADKALGDPELRHWNVSQGHAVSTDLKNWSHKGTCFRPAENPAWDDYTTWTGSVLSGPGGQWHLFYTGTCRAENGLKQRIGHAVSKDLHNWERVEDGLCLDLSGSVYEEYTPGHWHDRAMRDPWVIRDPEGAGWLMFFTARIRGVSEANAGGAIGCASSQDLCSWTLEPPVFAGGFGQLEVPQVFQHTERWYCLFCTDAKHWSAAHRKEYPGEPVTGTHYLMADAPRGPWRIAPGQFLDGSPDGKRYAGRIVDTGDSLVFLGFLGTGDTGFVGVVDDPVTVNVDTDGQLSLADVDS